MNQHRININQQKKTTWIITNQSKINIDPHKSTQNQYKSTKINIKHYKSEQNQQ